LLTLILVEMPPKLPKYHEFQNPLLSALQKLGGSGTLSELNGETLKSMSLSPEVAEVLHGQTGRTEVEYRMAWARTYLKKYGLITNSSRGVWALTPQGQTTPSVNPMEVVRAVREQRRKRLKTTTPVHLVVDLVDDPEALEPSSTGESNWEEQLQEILLALPPDRFERLCQRLLRESGFIQVEVTGRSGDGGIDGHGIVRIGLLSFPVIFQSKRYRGSVGAGDIRNFRGAMVGRSDRGLFITTGSFTAAANAEATRDGAPRLDLIDGATLTNMLIELKLGVRTRTEEVTYVDDAWFNAL
jgi:restriction system protein